MRPLSAGEAIGPAWNYTRHLLITPRRWRTLFKITAVAFFAQIGGGFSGSFGRSSQMHGIPPVVHAAFLAVALVIGLVFFVVGLLFFYLNSRLQFVLFEVMLRRDTTVGPIWSRYGRATWHWIGLKLLYFLIALLCCAPVVVPVLIHFFHVTAAHEAAPQFGLIVSTLLEFMAAMFFVLLIVGTGYVLLADFGLPSMALESTPMRVTVGRVWALLRAETGQVLLYVLLRFVLAIVWAMCAYFALGIGTLIALVPLGGAGVGLWFECRHAGLVGHAVMIAGWAVLGLVLLALFVVAAIMLVGYMMAFLQAYALFFLGGRYPLLGQYLEPFVPQLTYAYPVPPMIPPPAEPSPESAPGV